MSREPLLDRDAVLDALREMAGMLHGSGQHGEIHVFGGTAMLLTLDARRVTRDIDAVWSPDTPVLQAAQQVARRRGWPDSWLNSRGSSYLSPLAEDDRFAVQWPGLAVYAATPEHLLAMKVAAGRASDAGDIEVLVRHLDLRDVPAVMAIHAQHFPGVEVAPHKRLLVEDVLQKLDEHT